VRFLRRAATDPPPTAQEVFKRSRDQRLTIDCPPRSEVAPCPACTARMKPMTGNTEWWHRTDVTCDEAWRAAALWPHSEVPPDENHRQALRRLNAPQESNLRPAAWPDGTTGPRPSAWDRQRDGGRLPTDSK